MLYIRILYVSAAIIAGLLFFSCSSGSSGPSGPDINPPYLIQPVNGLKTSSQTPFFIFKHTNAGIEGVYYDFALSDSYSFSNTVYYLSGIVPASDRYRVDIGISLNPGKEYFYRTTARKVEDDDSAVSNIYSIYIENVGANTPNLYMCAGDSITDSGFTGMDYSDFLQDYLQPYFGESARTVNEGIPGLYAWELKGLIEMFLYFNRPAYTTILIGINDLRHPGSCPEPFNCETVQEIVDTAYYCKWYGSIPVVCTLIPAVGYTGTLYDAQIRQFNSELYEACLFHQIDIVDLYDAFSDYDGNIEELFADDIHPNISGNQLIASAIFDYLSNRTINSSATLWSEDSPVKNRRIEPGRKGKISSPIISLD